MSKNNSYFVLGVIIFLLGCNTAPSKRSSIDSGIKYSDIDLFTLTGTSKLDASSYPCFSIDSINKRKKLIIFYYSDKIWDSATYEFYGNYWTTTHTFLADTARINLVKNNYKDKIVELEYYGGSSNLRVLFSVTVFQDNKQFTYYLRKPHKISASEVNPVLLQDSMNEIIKDSFSIKNGFLKIISVDRNYEYNEIKYDTICYNINYHSVFWWLSFGNFIDKKEKSCK